MARRHPVRTASRAIGRTAAALLRLLAHAVQATWRTVARWRRRRPRTFVATAAAVALAVAIWGPWSVRADSGRWRWSQAQILRAIALVESGNREDVPDGDGGLAIGPFQIHRDYWLDATRADPTLQGDWQDCRGYRYAERVVRTYLHRWGEPAWSEGRAEVAARIHNGGPGGAQKAATLSYWRRVRARLPD